MSKKCVKCGEDIHEGRLKALPKTKVCIECSCAKKVAGFALITGKNTYSEIQIVDQETSEELRKLQERKGQSPAEGVKFDSYDNGEMN